jgi:hypothetical protein
MRTGSAAATRRKSSTRQQLVKTTLTVLITYSRAQGAMSIAESTQPNAP